VRAAALFLLTACMIGPLDYAGKTCTTSCPDGYGCTGGICVPAGGHFCDFFTSATSCLDFDEGLPLDAGWKIEVTPGALSIDADSGTLVSQVAEADGGNGTPGRLVFDTPPWQHVRESFDLKPVLVAQSYFVAISEIQCVGPFEGAWFHYVANGATSQFELRSGSTTQQVFLSPQPPMGEWSRITLEAIYGSPPVANVFVNGVLAASTPILISGCGDAGFETNLGLSPESGDTVERADIDNVVLDITPR
jgi:hypothetical protein